MGEAIPGDMMVDGTVVLHRPAAAWIGGVVAASTLIVLATCISVLGAALLFAYELGLAVGLIIVSAWLALLANYVWQDCMARRGWQIEIEPGELKLDLPAHRSLMDAGRRLRRRLEVSDVAAIETRLEAYRTFGMVNMHRNYGLRLKSGDLIVLGEDRALASDLSDETMGRFVETIRLKTGLPLRDIGMVEGAGGFLGVLFSSLPRWDEPSLQVERQVMLWQRAALTGGMAGTVLLIGFLVSLFI